MELERTIEFNRYRGYETEVMSPPEELKKLNRLKKSMAMNNSFLSMIMTIH